MLTGCGSTRAHDSARYKTTSIVSRPSCLLEVASRERGLLLKATVCPPKTLWSILAPHIPISMPPSTNDNPHKRHGRVATGRQSRQTLPDTVTTHSTRLTPAWRQFRQHRPSQKQSQSTTQAQHVAVDGRYQRYETVTCNKLPVRGRYQHR